MALNSQFPSLKADKFKTANVPRKMRPSEIYSSPRLTAPIRCACQPGSLLKNQDKAAARPHCPPNGWQREERKASGCSVCFFFFLFPSDRLLSSCPLLQPPPQRYSGSRLKQPSWSKLSLCCCRMRTAKCCRNSQGAAISRTHGWQQLAASSPWGQDNPTGQGGTRGSQQPDKTLPIWCWSGWDGRAVAPGWDVGGPMGLSHRTALAGISHKVSE